MRNFYFLILFLGIFSLSTPAKATHIVGGEFELISLGNFSYRINLILYFDEVNGASSILNTETTIFPAIFRKSDGGLMDQITLNRLSIEDVPYTNPECAVGSLSTLKLTFTNRVFLDPARYNSKQGYYLIWERCCRNYTIDNIFSENPTVGLAAGQTFFLEFPPVVDENGNEFVNSSPVLFPPLSDYACANRLYFADFAGEDPDGDSIVYSMVTPLSTSQLIALPPPTAPPHPNVEWRDGFSFLDQIPGDPSINISKEGLLTVRPSVVGLFVFAVKAEEFRDGRKIGETRRDFQMLVLDCPDPGVKPELKVEVPPSDLNEGGIFTDELSVEFSQDDDRCVKFLITDQDGSQTVEIKAVAVNFEDNDNTIFSVTSGFIEDENTVLEIEVCFEECPPLQDIPFIIDFIASDDACPLPLKDTLRMNVLVEPPTNTAPELSSNNNDLLDSIVTLYIGEVIDLGIIGTDADGDSLALFLAEVDALTASLGFSFAPVNGLGEVSSGFFWQPTCEDIARIDTLDVIHEFTFVLQDNAKCLPQTDTLVVKAKLADIEFSVDPNDIPNIFTPNGDEINDTWGLGQFFPPDTCEDEFLSVTIVNRWGRPVFSSNDRNFSWDGDNSASGVYYYYLQFRNSEYNGHLTLMK